jgi:hypothetical protein
MGCFIKKAESGITAGLSLCDFYKSICSVVRLFDCRANKLSADIQAETALAAG